MPTFHFRLIPFAATLILVTLGCVLAYWQTQRAEQKEAIEAKLQAREKIPAIELPLSIDMPQMEYQRVKLQGEFMRDWPIYLDNRPMHGKAGMVVLMPFKLHDRSDYVLVARGWIPRNVRDRTAIQPYPTPLGQVHIEGILKSNSGHVLQLGQIEPLHPQALIQNLDISELAQASHFPMYSFIVEQTSDTHDGLIRRWPRASTGSEKHRGYAFQWVALASAALVFFLVTGFKYGCGTKKDSTG